jgi:Type IV secretion-system coupling protein DNA-binding domain
MLATLTHGLNALSHGWSGLVLGYASVQGPMLTALIRSRAQLRKLLWSPVMAIPVTLLAGVGTSIIQPVLRGLGVAHGGLMQLAAGFAVSATVGYVSGRIIAKHESAEFSHQRGTLISDSDAPDRPPRARESRGRDRDSAAQERGSESVSLAGRRVPFADETKHFKFVGTTGTGKSTAISEVLEGALKRGDRAIIADPDGGYLRRFYDESRGDVILNPFEPKAAKWDLYGEITNDYDINQLARSLIPDHEGSERSWCAYGRTFLGAVVKQTHEGGIRDVRELYRVLATAKTSEIKTLVAGTPAQPFLEDNNLKMFDSIRSVTMSAVEGLEYIGKQQGEPLSVRNWVNNGKGVLFIPYRAGQIAALRSTISAWMRLAIFETMNAGEGDRRLWFAVDELDALGQIDGLKDALARLRKFGGRCLLGFQSIAQVSGTYGRAAAQTIVENCGNTVIFRCAGSENGGTSQFASRLIGQREVVRTTESRSRRGLQLMPSVTRSEHRSVEFAVLDSEIEQLPDLKGYLKLASSPEWRRVALAPPASAQADEVASRARAEARRNWEASKFHEHSHEYGNERSNEEGKGRGNVRGDAQALARGDAGGPVTQTKGRVGDGFEP